MYIKREIYVNRLADRMHNGMVKVVTGMRRSGKSFLLFNLFADYLLRKGVDEKHPNKMSMVKS